MKLKPTLIAFAGIAIAAAMLPITAFAQTAPATSLPFTVVYLEPIAPLTDAEKAALTEAQALQRQEHLTASLNEIRALIAAQAQAKVAPTTLPTTTTTSTTTTTTKPYIAEPVQTPAPAPAPAPTIYPYAAEAGPLTLLNCSGGGINVKTFNSNDTMLWVAFQEQSIGNGASAGLKCATSACKLKVNSGGATAAMSGYQVYIGGTAKATNKAAVTKGCSIY